MKYFLISLLLFAFSSCSVAQQRYSSKNKKAIKLFEAGKAEPGLSIDYTTNGPNFKGGIALMDKALEKDPNFWEAHMIAGEFAEMLKDYA